MIYSASRRTDLPAAHADWLAARLGRSRALEAVVYWTKAPASLVRHPELSRLAVRWPAVVQLTVTGRAGSVWEPGVAPLLSWLDELRELAATLPAGAVLWRFDPIVLPGAVDARTAAAELTEHFLRTRAALEPALGPLTETTTSFFQPYRHAVARMRGAGLVWRTPGAAERIDLLGELARAAGPGFVFRMCCEPGLPGADDLPVLPAACVDAERFDRLYGTRLAPRGKDPGQRSACRCGQSTDIGRYDMGCPHGCVYCYAMRDA